MKLKNYLSIVAFVFLVLAVAHAWRIMTEAHVTIADAVIPLWVSWVSITVSGYLSYAGYKLRK